MKFYKGIVEDNQDPLKCGRVKVRIFGIHTENNENSSEVFNFIKTSDLPWAEVNGGTDLGLVGGIGITSILKKGTMVRIVLDDDDPNLPIVIGTVKGIPGVQHTYASGKGFVDPDGIHPMTTGRSDLHPGADTKYDDITIIQTSSGHLIEFDDTSGSERIKITHKNGTSFFEIASSGNITIDAGTANVTIKGTRIDLNP